MARYFVEVMYDGTAFHGSQIQGRTPTVQLAINIALSTLLRLPVISFGASRTDEGVHALCNFYHFDTDDSLPDNFLYRLNALLPDTVVVKHVYNVPNDLNARFDALSRRYRYRICQKRNPFLLHRALFYPFRIEPEILHLTAEILKEYKNFESFSKRNTQTNSFLCTLTQSCWGWKDDELHYLVEGNRFLRGMVRGLVATQLKVARGQMSIETFRKVIESRDCTQAYFNVSGHGLYLEHIAYPEGVLNLQY